MHHRETPNFLPLSFFLSFTVLGRKVCLHRSLNIPVRSSQLLKGDIEWCVCHLLKLRYTILLLLGRQLDDGGGGRHLNLELLTWVHSLRNNNLHSLPRWRCYNHWHACAHAMWNRNCHCGHCRLLRLLNLWQRLLNRLCLCDVVLLLICCIDEVGGIPTAVR